MTRRRRRWRAWAGSLSDLERIGEISQELFQKRQKARLDEFDKETARLKREAASKSQEFDERWRSEERRILQEELIFGVILREGIDETIGPLSVVMREVDRRSADGIRFEGGRFTALEELKLKFSRTEPHAVSLVISSPDQGWAREAFSHLSEKIDARQPWWSWILHPFFIWTSAIMAALAVYYVSYTVLKHFLGPIFEVSKADPNVATIDAGSYVVFLVPFLLLIAAAMSILLQPIRVRLFSPFEIVGDSQSTGTRVIIYITTILISLVAGIYVNIIT